MFVRPLRPLVAIPDFVVAVTAALLLVQTSGVVMLYLTVAGLLFLGSSVHHWLSPARWHGVLDMVMIYCMIVATPLPHMSSILESNFFFVYLAAVAGALLGIVLFLSGYTLKPRRFMSTLYAAVFTAGAASLLGAEFDSSHGYVFLWMGVFLFAIQGIIFNRVWPNESWYRVVQHGFLYLAFACHAIVTLNYI